MGVVPRWILLSLFVCACDGPVETVDAAIRDTGSRPPDSIGTEDRPARLFVPPAHDGVTELPLVVLLHGYTVDSFVQDLYFGMTRYARSEGFYLLLPDGTLDADGEPHWDVISAAVDDHAYLRGLIEELMAIAPVDPSAVSIIGHSNGAFMAYRLACDSADLVTSIASLAGSDVIAGCMPADDVSILEIHGNADGTVPYDGGSIAGLVFPSATDVVAAWATRVGCDATGTTMGAPLDLTYDVDGAETSVLAYGGACRAGVELWTMDGVDHIPSLTAEFTPTVLAWLRAHPR